MIISGKKLAETIQDEIKEKILNLGITPGLGVILVGDHTPSRSYIEGKRKACEKVGIKFYLTELKSNISQNALLLTIEKMNKDPRIHGILMQLPLPEHLNVEDAILAIDPKKDVDGLHPLNLGKLLLGLKDGFIPCTPLGIKEMLLRSHIPTQGKNAVILGRSNIVGKPLACLLMQKPLDATVTVVHSKSHNINSLCASADILVAAIGSPLYVKKEMVKEGAVIIDVGINRIEDSLNSKGYKIVGDVDFENVLEKASFLTPVPQGVGPMTIAMLLQNTLIAALKN